MSAAVGGPVWERKRRGARAVFDLALQGYVLSFRNWLFFAPNWILSLAGTAVGVATYYLMARYVQGASDLVQAYGGSLAAYIVLGMILNGVLQASLTTAIQALGDGYWANIFEVYNVLPGGIPAYLLSALGRNYTFVVMNGAINLLVGIGLFGLRLQLHGLGAGIAVVALAAVAMAGIGLVAGCSFVFLSCKNRNDPLSWVVGIGGGLLAGVYFPVSVLPEWARHISAFLPQTYAYDAARRILLAGAGWGDPHVRADVAVLGAVAAVAVPVGALLLAWSIRVGERAGTFTRWN